MKQLQGIPLEAYQHPKDKSALIRLQSFPILGKAMEFVTGSIERFANVNRMGNGIHLSEQSYPDLFHEFLEVANILGMHNLPRLYVQWGYDLHVSTDGDKNPITIINSGIVDLLTKEERRFYFGHEMGHILANHLGYLLLCRYLPLVSNSVRGSSLLFAPLLHYSRMTEFTADRIGLLACQSIDVAISTMMKQAGLPCKYFHNINIESLKQQIEDFRVLREQTAGAIVEGISLLDNNMPWIVNRGAMLLDWYYNGDYQQIIEQYGV